MDEDKVLRTLRYMAWERAKGELESMLQTYWNEPTYEKFNEAVRDFISEVENYGKHE